ncbi:HNH endonuclease signature motif containing protein [Agromyces sp. Root1464]|uniref:HNH endonuclease signature motif containing protein n=1 Tax=Agromyces sp. Root1464 TaxID=1736467 RepID=UPI0009E943A6|nr:HNH endonuclease signature motif containing protein [Agromyces sp. Root1464]
MPFALENASSSGISPSEDGVGADRERSPYALAQDGLAQLVNAAVQAQRVEAMNAAMRVDVVFLTVSFALRAERAFVSPNLSPARRRELARRSVTAELATALHVPESTMQRQIDDAWALSTQLPATLSSLREGSLSMQHARVIVEAVAELDDEPRVLAELDEQLARFASDHTAAAVRRKARSLREELQAQSVADRHRAARQKRRVEIEPALDGMAWLHALLPAADALLIKDRLDRVAREAGECADDVSRLGSEPAGEHAVRIVASTNDQIRADALRDLLLYGGLGDDSAFAAACGRVRPSVHVTVPVLTLMGSSTEPALLDGYGPIDPEAARRLAAQAPSFVRLLSDPVTGTVLDVDRTSYRPPADLKRWLQVRDGTCRFPGCNRNASRSELDHSIDWADVGRTAFDNLAHLCSLHHHLKHETSWSMRHLAGAVLEWTSPSGRVHRTHPARTMSRMSSRADDARAAESPPLTTPPDAAAQLRFAEAPPF